MQHAKLEPIAPETLENVVGGEGAGWLGMLSGGKLNIGSMLGGANPNGGAFGLNKEGKGKSLSEGIAGWITGGDGVKTVEGKDHQGFGG